MKTKIEELEREGFSVVVYLDNDLVKRIDPGSRLEILNKARELKLKVYTNNDIVQVTRRKKPYILRYGNLPDPISSRVSLKGGRVVSGNL